MEGAKIRKQAAIRYHKIQGALRSQKELHFRTCCHPWAHPTIHLLTYAAFDPMRKFFCCGSSVEMIETLNWDLQGGLDPSKISGVGTNLGLLVHILPGPNKQCACKKTKRMLLSWIRRLNSKPGCLVRSTIHFTIFFDSRCPFGQTDNRKQILGRFKSHFQTDCRLVDFKNALRPFDCTEWNFMGHRWLIFMVICKCSRMRFWR
jgi:hypothetical protein